ncbi:MAG: hypothetical protein AB7K09_18705 [Planctomycetota bacterium]
MRANRGRIVLLAATMLAMWVGLSGAQPGPPPPAADDDEWVTWQVDLSFVFDAPADAPPMSLRLVRPADELTFEDDPSAPLTIEDVGMLLDAAVGPDCRCVPIGDRGLAVSAPRKQQSTITAMLDQLTAMAARAHVGITLMRMSAPAWRSLRNRFSDSSATVAELDAWIDEAGDEVSAVVRSDCSAAFRQRTRVSHTTSRRYVRNAVPETPLRDQPFVALDPVVDAWRTGWSVELRPLAAIGGDGVLVDVCAQVAQPDGDLRTITMASGLSIELPQQRWIGLNATVLCRPGGLRLLAAGPDPIDATSAVTVFALGLASPMTARPASVQVGTLFRHGTRLDDVSALTCATRSTPPLCVSRSIDAWRRDEPAASGTIATPPDRLPALLEVLLDGVELGELQIAPFGPDYLWCEVADDDAPLVTRALAGLRESAPRPLVTDVAGFVLDRVGQRALRPLERAGNTFGPAAVAAVLARAPDVDTTIWHVEQQTVAASQLHERAVLADHNMSTRHGMPASPVVDVVAGGISLAVRARRCTGGAFVLQLTGDIGRISEMREGVFHTLKDGAVEPIELPTVAGSTFAFEHRVAAGEWAAHRVAADSDGRTLLLLTRTRPAD